MSARSSLRGRIPGQAAMTEVLAAQESAAPRSRFARIIGQSPLSAENRNLYRAAIGECLVGDMLDTLGPRWDVLHVVPIDGGAKDIDHLVIGPPGVFAIVTENYPGQEVRVDGDTLAIGNRFTDDLTAARELGDSAATHLGTAIGTAVQVTALIVVVSPTRLIVQQQPAGVTVIGSKHLVHHFEGLDTALTGADVASISDSAERDTTWLETAVPPQDTQQLLHDFGALRKSVEESTQARVFWAAVGFAFVAAIMWLSTATLVQQLLRH
jgi:hypothetical protein